MRGLLTAVLFAAPLAADTLVLDEEAAVQRALAQNPEIATYRAKLDEARAKITQARAGFMPHLSLSAGYTYLSYVSEMEMEVPNFDSFPNITLDTVTVQFGRHNNYKAEAQVSQVLFSWGAIWNAYKMAQEGYRAAELSLEAKKTEVASAVRTAFWGALTAREYLSLSQKTAANLEDHYKDAQKRYRAGTAPQIEVLTAEVKWRNSLPRVEDAKKAYQDALDGLKLLLNIPQETVLKLQGEPAVENADFDEDSLVVLALAKRPELASMKQQIKALRRLVSVQSAGDKPQVVAFGGYSYARPYGLEDAWGGTWSAGVSLSWNIFDGLSSRGKTHEAQAQLEQLELAENLRAEAVKQEVRAALRSLRDAKAKLSSAEATVSLAEKSLSIVETQVRSGVAKTLDLYDAETNLFQARTNLIASQMQYIASLAALEKAVGVPVSQMPKKESKDEKGN